MPNFTYQPRSINDPSMLSEGWHPAYLLHIADEATPEQWTMYESSPRLWRWLFAVWETPQHVQATTPELQSVPTSQKFSPGGRYQPSKAYTWTCTLLGRAVQAGESVSLDAALPLPCRLKIRRVNGQGQPIEFANIVDLEPWPDGASLLTPELQQKLTTWFGMKQAGTPVPAPAPVAQPRPVPAPASDARAGWGSPAPAHTPAAQPPERQPLAW
jgi:hypothetical protein